jgi:hypothetical protein
MLATIRQAAADTRSGVPITLAALDDLNAKKDHCRAAGLGAEARVEVKTKRQGLEEVKGLEVWYLEQFLASDPSATPHRFKSFSSPAAEQVVPGRYLFWARHPGSGQTGAKTEQRIATAPGTTIGSQPFRVEIEVLAP